MSYFPEDIPFMSKEELRENGIRIPKDTTDINVGDTISRQAALEKVRSMQAYKLFDDIILIDKAAVQTELMMLPTVQPEPQWIPVEMELPKDRKSVIVCYRYWLQFSQKFVYAIVIGWHASKFSVKAEVFTEWDGDFDYNKEQDENYIPEGWYEFTTQGNGDLMDWYIDAEVIAWMPLPEPYKPNNK